jgi:hypothetical protein
MGSMQCQERFSWQSTLDGSQTPGCLICSEQRNRAKEKDTR